MNSTIQVNIDSASRRDWGSLRKEIIDLIVENLKQTNRWNREGPLFRSLNKHWSHQIDKHIVQAHPHSSRVLVKEDLDALLKFPNLTSADFTQFCLWGMVPPEGRSLQHIGTWKTCIHKDKLLSVGQKLKHIPKLVELKIGTNVQWMQINEKNSKITILSSELWNPSLGLRDKRLLLNPDVGYWHFGEILPLSLMPIEEITEWIDCFGVPFFTSHFPHLKAAKINNVDEDHPFILIQGQKLEDVSLDVYKIESLGRLELWPNLTTFRCPIESVDEALFLKDLVNIEELEVSMACGNPGENVNGMKREDFLKTQEIVFGLPLEKLHVENANHDKLELQDEVFTLQSNLKELVLTRCSVSGTAILQNIPSLCRLSFIRCFLKDEMKFWEFIDQPNTIEGKTLNQIHELTISDVFYGNDAFWNQRIYPHISKMKNLNKLVLNGNDLALRIAEFEILSHSNTLRKLQINSCAWTRQDSKSTSRMNFFSFLDELRILNLESRTPLTDFEAAGRELKEVAPWIKIEIIGFERIRPDSPGGEMSKYDGLKSILAGLNVDSPKRIHI